MHTEHYVKAPWNEFNGLLVTLGLNYVPSRQSPCEEKAGEDEGEESND